MNYTILMGGSNMENTTAATMHAAVLRVCPCQLLVCDHDTSQEVLVHTPKACCFSVGEQICIEYNGIMTRSIPPQITADCVRRASCCC